MGCEKLPTKDARAKSIVVTQKQIAQHIVSLVLQKLDATTL
jgi:hypothetical protein